MSQGKHVAYIVYVYAKDSNSNHSEEIKLAVNKQLAGKAHVNKVKEVKVEEVQ